MKKISLFVVTAAAVALVLSGCSRGPGTDDMMPDEQAMMPSLDGTWYFAAAVVEVDAGAFTVTAGDGTMALGTEGHFAMITMVVVKGTIAAQDGAYHVDGGHRRRFGSIDIRANSTGSSARHGEGYR